MVESARVPLVSAQTTARQGFRFLVVGGFNTVLSYSIFWMLCALLHPQLALAIVYAFGIVLAYLLNALWVFGVRTSWRSAATYPLVYLLTYLINAGLLQLSSEWLGWSPQLGLAAALCVSTPISFALNRYFLLAPKSKPGAPHG